MEMLGGPLFAVAGAGESHGPGVTTIVFGCPPGLEISRGQIQEFLDRRRPGSTKHGTVRKEDDKVVLLSGLYSDDTERLLSGSSVQVRVGEEVFRTSGYEQGYTTGEPIAALVLSASRRSGDYSQFSGPRGEVRPGHTDLVKYHKARGFVDVRGGGRSSYRSTISDVVGGSISRIYLKHHFRTEILSSICQVGPLKSSQRLEDVLLSLGCGEGGVEIQSSGIVEVQERLSSHVIYSVDGEFSQAAADLIRKTRTEGDSLGAAVEVVAVNVPPLLGEPLYQSLKNRLMGALGGLHAVQSCEIGAGFDVVGRKGSENNDPIRQTGYRQNSHGGLMGGVTTGMPLVLRVGFKPTSSIVQKQLSVRKDFSEIDFQLKKGRHDPCVGVRAGVTLESRVAIELMNAVLWHQSGNVDPAGFRLFEG